MTIWCIALAILSGCGRAPTYPVDAADAPAVRPAETEPAAAPAVTPADSASAPATQAPAEPPGNLELPADFNPEREGQITPPGTVGANPAGGFEMPTPPEGVQAPAPAAAEPSEADANDVSLKAAEWDEISKTITSAGRITVVDFWSLACEPCLKEFPGLVAIHRDLGDRVACFSVDVDYDGRKTKPAESYRPRVEAFLKSVGATFPNFLSETPSDDLFSALGIDSIPAVLIYDADGELVRTFSDVGADAGFTYEDNVRPFVQQLLADNP